jgi:hypothetical protein
MNESTYGNYSDDIFVRAMELGCWPVQARQTRQGQDSTMPWKCGCFDQRHNGSEGLINLSALLRVERAKATA